MSDCRAAYGFLQLGPMVAENEHIAYAHLEHFKTDQNDLEYSRTFWSVLEHKIVAGNCFDFIGANNIYNYTMRNCPKNISIFYTGLVDYFYDFWIQKQCTISTNPGSRNDVDRSKIFGSRNCAFFVISESQNCTISTISGSF